MCVMLKDMLNRKGVQYHMEMNKSIMSEKGITHVPMIEMDDGKMLDARQAIEFFNERGAAYVRG